MDLFERVLERVLEWLPLASHPPDSRTLVAGLIVVAGFVVVVLLVRRRRTKLVSAYDALLEGIEGHVSAMARPLMTAADVSMFNLLLLVVRDHFLLLSKVPLRNLLQLRVEDDSSKRVVAQALRNVTVDFVLVHPGTRLPVKAVFLEKPGDGATALQAQEWLREALLLKAGIAVIWLDQEARYSVEELTNLLGLDEDT